MSYQLYDVNGYVADLATGSGLMELLEYLREQDNPGLRELGGALATEATSETIQAIQDIPSPESKTLKSTLDGLKLNAPKCREIIIIGDGMVEDAEQK